MPGFMLTGNQIQFFSRCDLCGKEIESEWCKNENKTRIDVLRWLLEQGWIQKGVHDFCEECQYDKKVVEI